MENTQLPSAWQLGMNVHLPAHVIGVHFTEGKVHYHVRLVDDSELVVDSVCVNRFPMGTPEPTSAPPETLQTASCVSAA